MPQTRSIYLVPSQPARLKILYTAWGFWFSVYQAVAQLRVIQLRHSHNNTINQGPISSWAFLSVVIFYTQINHHSPKPKQFQYDW